jgi:hypothetical protein
MQKGPTKDYKGCKKDQHLGVSNKMSQQSSGREMSNKGNCTSACGTCQGASTT